MSSPSLPREATPAPESTAQSRPSGAGWFRAFWRWHFYASFLVVPILLILAVTGLIYLFRFQIEPLLNADLMRVEAPASAQAASYDDQVQLVQEAYPGAELVSLTEPGSREESTRISIVTAAGEGRDVFVDPYGFEVLGALDPDRTVSGTAVLLHGELMSGRVGDFVIELAACWALVMAVTGYVLFVRGRRARARQGRKGRLRRNHARIGSVVGVGLLFLLVSGLPWTGVWGEQVQRLATANGSSMWSLDPGAVSDPTSTLDESLPHSHAAEVPWGLGKSEVPTSEADGARSIANVDTAVATADAAGLAHPMTVALPSGEDGVFSVIGYAFHDPSQERTVHVDRFGGEVVSAYGFEDYPLLAKVVSQGIGLHEGRSLGLVSFWGAALMCLGVIAMCVTGPLMWWRRRPQGGIGAPRGRMPVASTPWLAAVLLVTAVVLPVFGASLLVVLLLDRFVVRRSQRLSGALGTVS